LPAFATHKPFAGSICALVTPFGADGAIDFDALARLIAHQIDGGTDALVIAGSTGESVSLGTDEFSELVRASVKLAAGGIRIMAGAGVPSTTKSIELCHLSADAGAESALVVTPAYCRPTQDGLAQHYLAIAAHSPIPIMLYNVPARTGVDLLPETVARLCSHSNICGIKEALPDMARVRALIALQSADFAIFSGDDASAEDALKLGANGLISVAANAVPAPMKALVSGTLSEEQRALLHTLFDALGCEPNPIPVKWAMHVLNLCRPCLRLPLTVLTQAHRRRVHTALDPLLSAQPHAA
jgi:4-hydroxy-tetrahydrodipicolinate synthase